MLGSKQWVNDDIIFCLNSPLSHVVNIEKFIHSLRGHLSQSWYFKESATSEQYNFSLG